MAPKRLFDDEGNEYQVLRFKGKQFVVELKDDHMSERDHSTERTTRKPMNFSRRSSSPDGDSSDEDYSRRLTKAPSPQRRLPSKARRTLEPSSKQHYPRKSGPISKNILELIEEDEAKSRTRTSPNSRMKLLSRAERARR